MIGLYYVQMWKQIVMIFLCDIFSGARGRLKSLHNHKAGSDACRQLQSEEMAEMADCWWGPMQRKTKSRMMLKYIAIEFVQAQQIWLKVNTILGTKWVDGTVRESSSDDPTRVADWVGRSTRVQHRACAIPNVVVIVNTVAAEAPLWFRGNIGLPRLINRLQ